MNGDRKTLVRMEKLTAAEYLLRPGAPPQRLVENVWMRIEEAQTWGVCAPTCCEIGLLLAIMGSVHPYESGRCVLIGRGMMRRKRVVLPHVFYIGNADMIGGAMTALEYLMLATAKLPVKPAARQHMLLEQLVADGLKELALTPLRWLDDAEKAAVILTAASHSQSDIVILNLPGLAYGDAMRGAIARIGARMREQGKALVIGTRDNGLIQRACTHAALLARGKMLFQGTVAGLRARFDVYDVLADIDAGDEKKLRDRYPAFVFARRGGDLLIGGGGRPARDIFRAVLDAGVTPAGMRVNEKTVQNAWEALARKHDLP